MPKERNSKKKSPKFNRDTNTKNNRKETENFWKHKATIENNASESKFARLNQNYKNIKYKNQTESQN